MNFDIENESSNIEINKEISIINKNYPEIATTQRNINY